MRTGCNGFVATCFLWGKHGNIERLKNGNAQAKMEKWKDVTARLSYVAALTGRSFSFHT